MTSSSFLHMPKETETPRTKMLCIACQKRPAKRGKTLCALCTVQAEKDFADRKRRANG